MARCSTGLVDFSDDESSLGSEPPSEATPVQGVSFSPEWPACPERSWLESLRGELRHASLEQMRKLRECAGAAAEGGPADGLGSAADSFLDAVQRLAAAEWDGMARPSSAATAEKPPQLPPAGSAPGLPPPPRAAAAQPCTTPPRAPPCAGHAGSAAGARGAAPAPRARSEEATFQQALLEIVKEMSPDARGFRFEAAAASDTLQHAFDESQQLRRALDEALSPLCVQMSRAADHTGDATSELVQRRRSIVRVNPPPSWAEQPLQAR
ncbi:unnamed protein product [Prorocentrum cordatum]|uniref:Uncharacterized protein n=1 Tax=Prorocentrum cordatum TaxID=2364126 RepID=A0ABN9T3Z1_9DINO|nr:unnamed protein product [Polarella glacialis]